MEGSASEASTPHSSSLCSSLRLSAFRSVREPFAPYAVELCAGAFSLWCIEHVNRFDRKCEACPPGESLSDWIDRWDYEARILEVNGVLLAAPHSTP
jgi:hypothetical protein